jgi:glycosyltransferase, family 1
MLQSNRFSGAENVVCQIISMCKSYGVEFAYSSRDGQIREALKDRNIEFYPIEKMSVSEFRRVIKEVKPDVIHAHDMAASFYAALACGNVPLVSHIHNNAFNSRGVSLKSILYYIAARKAKHIFWVSQSSYNGYVFHKSLEKKSSILYNVIDIEALKRKMEKDTNDYDFDIVYLGRLTYPKNPERLLRVLKKIRDKYQGVKIAVIGTGDLEAEIKRTAVEMGMSSSVKFLGFLSNPSKILHDAKAMIMTSRWEGTPMCALEAMALGVPIVSTPTDGLKDVISEGETGFLSDDDDVLAMRCVDLIKDEELYRRLSANSMSVAEKMMDMAKYADAILSSYNN